MNLLCLHDFNEGGYSAVAGEVCWFIPSVAGWLVDSFPGSWQAIVLPHGERSFGAGTINVAADMADVTAAIEAPPADKMMHKAKKRK